MVVALDKRTGDQIWACEMPSYGDETGVGGKNLKDGAGYASAVISEAGGVRQYIQLVGRGLIGVWMIGVRARSCRFLCARERRGRQVVGSEGVKERPARDQHPSSNMDGSEMAWSMVRGSMLRRVATSARSRTSRSVVGAAAQVVIRVAMVWLLMPFRCADSAAEPPCGYLDAGGSPRRWPMRHTSDLGWLIACNVA